MRALSCRLLVALLTIGALPAGATTDGMSASLSLVGFTKNGKFAVARWQLDGGTTSCGGAATMLLLSLGTGRLDEAVTLFAGKDCDVEPVSRSVGSRRWRERLRKEGGLQRGLRLKRGKQGLRGQIGPHRLAIHAKLAAPCKKIGQRVRLTLSAFNGLVAFPEAWQGEVSCGLYEAMRDYRKPDRIWAPPRLTAGRVEAKGAHAVVLFAGRPFVVPLAK